MNPRAALLLAALPLVALQAPSAAQDVGILQALPGIDRARLAIPDGSLAGHTVVVYEVDTQRTPQEALGEVERHWRAHGVDTVLQAQTGDWHVLSRHTGSAPGGDGDTAFEGFETLQLRASPRGGSEGLLTRWTQASGSNQHDTLARLVPPDAQRVRQLASGGQHERRGSTLVAHFARSLDDAEAHLHRHLARIGFEPMQADGQPKDLRWRDDRARFYRGAGAELLVTLHRQPQGASAVLHHVEVPK